MEHFDLLGLLLVLVAAWGSGAIAVRLGFPSVLGELLAGIILGPAVLHLLDPSDTLSVLAQVGVMVMMLYIGMHIDPTQLGRSSLPGFLAAIGGFIVPFGVTLLVMHGLGRSATEGLIAGISAGGTSLAMKSRILVDLKLLRTRLALVMMAGALVTDTLSLVVFAGVMSLVASGGSMDPGNIDVWQISLVALKAILFFVVTVAFGMKVLPWVGRKLTDRRLAAAGLTGRTFIFSFVVILAVGFGELAHLLGLHAILGAFIAGLFLSDRVLGRTLARELTDAVREASIGFLAPIFFVSAGFGVSFRVFVDAPLLLVGIVGVAVFGKVIGTVLFYLPSRNGWREGLAVAAGMNGRGAVEIIVARIGLERGLISEDVFSAIVFMAVFTTSTVPVLLKWTTEWLRKRGELALVHGGRRGILIIGASSIARILAHVLRSDEKPVATTTPAASDGDGAVQEPVKFPVAAAPAASPASAADRPVWLIDSDPADCKAATGEGLTVSCGNALHEQILAEAHAAEAEMALAMTPNAEINALATSVAKNIFQVPVVHVANTRRPRKGHQATLDLLEASDLFAGPALIDEWDYRIDRGEVEQAELEIKEPTSAVDLYQKLQADRPTLPLAVKSGTTIEPYHGGLKLQPGDRVVLLHALYVAQPWHRIGDRPIAAVTG